MVLRVVARTDVVAPAFDWSAQGPFAALLGLALTVIFFLFRRETRARDRAEERADKYEQLWRDEVAKNRRRDDD